jgi:hypothetical protein
MTAANWSLENVFTPKVRDYIAALEETNGHGGYLRLTIDETTRTAGISVSLDNADSSIAFEKDFNVPFAWAMAITHKEDNA